MGDRSRACGARRGPGRCTEAPDTSPPPRARYTPRIRSASVHVPCCVAHQKLPKKAAPSPPRVRRAQAPVRVSRGAHADRAAPMGVPSARAGGERANAPLSCRHLVTAPAWGGRTAQKGGFPPHGQTASAHWSCEFEERSAAAGGLRCRDPPHTSRARAAFRACAITPPETPVCPSRLS